MVSIEYSEAAVEVLRILKHMSHKDTEKIPESFLRFLEENCSKEYDAQLDYSKPIKEMNLKPKTQAILGLIYMKYWADEEQKEKFKQKIKENEKIYQEELRQKYNTDNLFTNKKKEKTELAIIPRKETIIQKIINKIKEIFRR